MDQTTQTILTLLDTRLKAAEGLLTKTNELAVDLEIRVEQLEEPDINRLEDRVDDLQRDVDRLLDAVEF